MSQPETKINIQLLAWCVLVVVELVIIVILSGWPIVLLLGLVLYRPIKDALNWPVTANLPEPAATPAAAPASEKK